MEITTILSILFIIILMPMAVAWLKMAPYVPARKKDLKTINQAVNLKKSERFYELWCGDAKVSHYIARNNPDSEILWVEFAFPVFIFAKIRQLINPQKNLKIELWDWFKKDFWNFDVIYFFAMPDSINKKIIPKFLAEAKPWARLVSYAFSIKDVDLLKHFEHKQFKTDEQSVWINVYTKK